MRAVAAAAMLLALAGCGRSVTSNYDEAPNLESWVAEVKARPAPPLDPLPVMQQFETFEYARRPCATPSARRSRTSAGAVARARIPIARKQVLEQFPLDSLDMVGTLGRGSDLVALVMAPDKVTYRVRPGVYMGQSDGRVTAVYEDRIELVELVPDGAGGWLERPASVALEDQ
jgi:type IV pilus assembly protein PilP